MIDNWISDITGKTGVLTRQRPMGLRPRRHFDGHTHVLASFRSAPEACPVWAWVCWRMEEVMNATSNGTCFDGPNPTDQYYPLCVSCLVCQWCVMWEPWFSLCPWLGMGEATMLTTRSRSTERNFFFRVHQLSQLLQLCKSRTSADDLQSPTSGHICVRWVHVSLCNYCYDSTCHSWSRNVSQLLQELSSKDWIDCWVQCLSGVCHQKHDWWALV